MTLDTYLQVTETYPECPISSLCHQNPIQSLTASHRSINIEYFYTICKQWYHLNHPPPFIKCIYEYTDCILYDSISNLFFVKIVTFFLPLSPTFIQALTQLIFFYLLIKNLIT